MSIAEFEEKEFEGPLNRQLGVPAPLVFAPMWSPGQVLEALVGFDVAMLTQSAVLWTALGYSTPPPGAVVTPTWWPTAPSQKLQRLPPFMLNVFLQYKRPEYLSRSNAAEWSSWNSAYFRFQITAHQQNALAACAQSLGANGCVAYACPAFYRRQDLFVHILAGTLLQNTHFAPVTPLSGHGTYTYINVASPGIAHSEPVSVKPLTLLNGSDGTPPAGASNLPPQDILRIAHKAANAAVDAEPSLVGNKDMFREAVDRAKNIFNKHPELHNKLPQLHNNTPDAIIDFMNVAIFSWMSGIMWTVYPVTAPARKSQR